MIDTVASSMLPALTPVGSVPKVSLTLSSSSSRSSSVAVKVKDFSVSPLLKVRSAGTPE